MKKLVLLIGIIFLSMNVVAQDKGDKYIVTSATASFGHLKEYSNVIIATTTESPLDTYLKFDAGFGWFVVKNFRLELALGISIEKMPREATSATAWLYNRFIGFNMCPSLSYYVRLANKFYYAPEIGVDFTFGKYTYEDVPSHAWDYPCRCYTFYANLLAFEYRVGPHFGLWVSIGGLNHYRWSYFDDDKVFYSSKSTEFNLNRGVVAAHIYL